MELHNLGKRSRTRPARKRVGRGTGSGLGKTSGRGHKGQMSRSGSGTRLGFEGGQMPLIRRLPKRGFKAPNRARYAIINVRDLNRFSDGETVDAAALTECGLVRQLRDGVRVLGEGVLERRLTVVAHAFTRTAQAKIEACGGSCQTSKRSGAKTAVKG